MNRKIKSGSEIDKEIKEIFESARNSKELGIKIQTYLDNLTGKELHSRDEIYDLFNVKLSSHVYKMKGKFIFSKEINKLFPFAKPISKYYCYDDYIINDKSDPKGVIEKPLLSCYRVPYNIHSMENNIGYKYNGIGPFKSYRELEELFSANKYILELFTFLEKNSNISDLILKNIEYSQKELLCEMIYRKITPLNSIFIYFDKQKTVKWNTENLYVLLNKKIPRNRIQQAIKRDLDNLRKGKFSVPDM